MFKSLSSANYHYEQFYLPNSDEEQKVLEQKIAASLNQGFHPDADTKMSHESKIIINDAMKYLVDVLDTLGPLCANKAAKILVKQLRKSCIKNYVTG